MVIRAAIVDDAEALADLHLDVWDEAYTGLISADILATRRSNRVDRVERWREILTADSNPVWLAEKEDRLVGFCSVLAPGRDDPEPGLPTLEVAALYVRAAVYGTGLGHALLSAALGEAPAYLWVLDGNTRAIRFYEREGFRFDGRTKVEQEGLERRMVRRPRRDGSDRSLDAVEE